MNRARSPRPIVAEPIARFFDLRHHGGTLTGSGSVGGGSMSGSRDHAIVFGSRCAISAQVRFVAGFTPPVAICV
jgi:hypothetical protein